MYVQYYISALNKAKCIGRIAWNTLLVRDRRHVTNLDAMFAECLEHQRLATADGSLKSVSKSIRNPFNLHPMHTIWSGIISLPFVYHKPTP